MSECIFCKIINGDIPSDKIFEDDKVFIFRDIAPEAPQHVLIVPKEHINNINELEEKHKSLIGHIFLCARDIAKKLEIDDNGYRVVVNTGEDGGQTVSHIHFHLLGGRSLNWPPG